MLTALIHADGHAPALAATFSALIPAVAAGSLGHAVVVSAMPDADCERVAEATGAGYVAAGAAPGWQAAARAARGRWLLLLTAGEVPEGDWLGALERHLMRAPDRPALLPLAGAAGLIERLLLLASGRRLRPGLVVPARMVATGRLDAAPLRLAARRRAA